MKMITKKQNLSLVFSSKYRHGVMCWLTVVFLLQSFSVFSQQIKLKITEPYLNIPISYSAKLEVMKINVESKTKREFPVQLANDTINYWIYIDVTEFKGQTITLNFPVASKSLSRIYQDVKINGADSLYKEINRLQFHFTVKRGWCNDVNGPIYFNNQYHLFWQSFPFGLKWNTTYMYWGHAVSNDLIHWTELPHALMLDSLGSPWSGSALIDKNNAGGWGKDALVLYYTAFNGVSKKQVQCIAYSTDNAKTFTRYAGNPVLDSNHEMGNDTRDPKVFWYEPSKQWVMVLFEKNGLSFYNSADMKKWEKQSRIEDLWECPDFFELPVDGNNNNKKWVLHGGSADYYIGNFDGKRFTPETPKLRYADGLYTWGDILYAAQTFENMPDNRRVQIAWARGIEHEGMPFTQMLLFPTEFGLKTTNKGLRLVANPIKEIALLHKQEYKWTSLTCQEANKKLELIKPQPLHVKISFTVDKGKSLKLYFHGKELVNLLSDDFPKAENEMEILIDKSIAEIFINKGERYIVKQLSSVTKNDGLYFESDKYGPFINKLEVFEMKSMWDGIK
jgi:sucrose-6-phosphate hydrolase SacC (GH32 family)